MIQGLEGDPSIGVRTCVFIFKTPGLGHPFVVHVLFGEGVLLLHLQHRTCKGVPFWNHTVKEAGREDGKTS